MDLISIIAIAILSTILVVITTLYIILTTKNRKFIQLIGQLLVDKNVMSDEIEKLSFVVNNGPTIENDFIKFLSESRESAYEYIAEVQDAIVALEKSMQLDDHNEIDKRYKELLKFLPSKNMDIAE